MSTQRSPTERTRNYCSILYPDSAPEDWEQKLRDLHVTSIISPLHSNENDDLKPHYHIVIMYDSVKTLKQAAMDFSSFGAIDRCQAIKAIRGYLRYLCHLDEDPRIKEHYDPYLVTVIGDFNYIEAINSVEDDLYKLMDITMFIANNNITNMMEFQKYNIAHNTDWFRVVAYKNTIYVREIIKAQWQLSLDK